MKVSPKAPGYNPVNKVPKLTGKSPKKWAPAKVVNGDAEVAASAADKYVVNLAPNDKWTTQRLINAGLKMLWPNPP